MWMVPRRLFSGLFGLLCCGGDRKGRRLLSKKARILTGRRPKVTVKVDGGGLRGGMGAHQAGAAAAAAGARSHLPPALAARRRPPHPLQRLLQPHLRADRLLQ